MYGCVCLIPCGLGSGPGVLPNPCTPREGETAASPGGWPQIDGFGPGLHVVPTRQRAFEFNYPYLYGETMCEVVMRGNIVMKGYFDDEEAMEKAFAGGWFHSGDIAVLHSRRLDRTAGPGGRRLPTC